MLLLGSILLVMMIGAADSQILFPTTTSRPIRPNKPCIASNEQEGTCFEFRTDEFKSCSSFFPSLDTSNTDVRNHLTENTCNNTGTELYFCCPSNTAPIQIPIPDQITTTEAPDQRPDFIPRENECGTSLAFNIVGGNVTQAGDWPWLAAIGQKIDIAFNQFCGGTLITKQHVISAAHCFTRKFEKTIVRLGEFDITELNDGALDFTIVDKRTPNYNHNTNENDLILLKLDRPLDTFIDSIRPACLPYHLRNDKLEGRTLTVVGWGIFDIKTRRSSDIPLQARVPVVPVKKCQEQYSKSTPNIILDSQLCAGTGGPDSCGGDSGGPINHLDLDKGRFYVVGAVSYGPENCGSDNLPGVYTRITSYLDWIDESIRQML